MITESLFAKVILFVKNSSLVTPFKTVLRTFGVKDVIPATTAKRCMIEMGENPYALLIIDWEMGPEPVVEILKASYSQRRLEVRPIYLFSIVEVPDLCNLAKEYYITKIYAGEISLQVLKEHFTTMQEAGVLSDQSREVLIKVAQLRSENNWQGAEEILKKMHETHKDQERFVAEYAENLMHENKFEEALVVIHPFTDGEKTSARCLNIKGRCLMKIGQIQEATKYLERARVINPYDIDRLIDLGNLYLTTGHLRFAKSSFEDATKLSPKNNAANAGMSNTLFQMGEINEALQFLEQLSGPEEMASVFNSAAIVSIQKTEYDKALELYRTGIKTLPETETGILSKLAYNMGLAYLRRREEQAALDCFYLATKLDENNSKAQNYVERISKKIKPSVEAEGVECINLLLKKSG